MFKDQKKKKKDWTHTGINLKHNKSNLQSDGPSSLFSLEGWSAEYCTSPQKKNTSWWSQVTTRELKTFNWFDNPSTPNSDGHYNTVFKSTHEPRPMVLLSLFFSWLMLPASCKGKVPLLSPYSPLVFPPPSPHARFDSLPTIWSQHSTIWMSKTG